MPEFHMHCIGCQKTPQELAEYEHAARDEGMTAAEYVALEEGTYNITNGHFVCTPCYLRMGAPVAESGRWIAP